MPGEPAPVRATPVPPPTRARARTKPWFAVFAWLLGTGCFPSLALVAFDDTGALSGAPFAMVTVDSMLGYVLAFPPAFAALALSRRVVRRRPGPPGRNDALATIDFLRRALRFRALATLVGVLVVVASLRRH